MRGGLDGENLLRFMALYLSLISHKLILIFSASSFVSKKSQRGTKMLIYVGVMQPSTLNVFLMMGFIWCNILTTTKYGSHVFMHGYRIYHGNVSLMPSPFFLVEGYAFFLYECWTYMLAYMITYVFLSLFDDIILVLPTPVMRR